jgi:thiol-disulfide isomerase/thioredoxin
MFAACGTEPGQAATAGTAGNTSAIDPTQTERTGATSKGKDAATTDTEQPTDVEAKSGQPGDVCKADVQCGTGVCWHEKCFAACKGAADCGKGEVCASPDGKRLLCHAPKYAPDLGAPCAIEGVCPAGLECVVAGIPDGKKFTNGNLLAAETAGAYCTAACQTDLDCPPRLQCLDDGQGAKCRLREFCGDCQHDGQCEPGAKCVQQDGGKFCARKCGQGSTECPRFADCKDVGGGEFQCLHRAGTCAGAGDLCSACNDPNDCAAGALCLTYQHTKESFCTQPCPSGSCPAGYACAAVGNAKHCTPNNTTNKCVAKISPNMEKGDIMEDFAMVGYVDTDDDTMLSDEEPKVLHLSDFQDKKLILLTLSAGWCGPCQIETKASKQTVKNVGAQNVAIFQVLIDGPQQPSLPTLAFAKQWVTQLNAAGAVGIDPTRLSNVFNTTGGIPLNILIEGKTMKILDKLSGMPPSMTSWLSTWAKKVP